MSTAFALRNRELHFLILEFVILFSKYFVCFDGQKSIWTLRPVRRYVIINGDLACLFCSSCGSFGDQHGKKAFPKTVSTGKVVWEKNQASVDPKRVPACTT